LALKRIAISLLICTLTPMASYAEPPPKGWKAASLVYVLATGADIYTTDKALNTGLAREMNPLLGSDPSDRRLYARGAAISGGVYLYLNHLRKSRPRAAQGFLWAFAGLHLLAAGHKHRLRGQLEGTDLGPQTH